MFIKKKQSSKMFELYLFKILLYY